MRKPGFSGPFDEGGQVLYQFENKLAPGGSEKRPFSIEVWVYKADTPFAKG